MNRLPGGGRRCRRNAACGADIGRVRFSLSLSLCLCLSLSLSLSLSLCLFRSPFLSPLSPPLSLSSVSLCHLFPAMLLPVYKHNSVPESSSIFSLCFPFCRAQSLPLPLSLCLRFHLSPLVAFVSVRLRRRRTLRLSGGTAAASPLPGQTGPRGPSRDAPRPFYSHRPGTMRCS